MKILCDVSNIVGNNADIHMPDGTVMCSWCFSEDPKNLEHVELKEVSVNKIIKLKESGFDAEEIISLSKEGLL